MTYSKIKEDNIADLKSSANEIKDNISDAANKAGRKVRNLFNTANDEILEVSDKVTSEIRTNPVRSSAIALGVGVVVGMLFSATRRG
jgi:ElaB/YqjD/DUF883 family membrane-anchored ribosome-binding protein